MEKHDSDRFELLVQESMKKTLSPKEARCLHRELKKYGCGLPVFVRFPNLPLWLSAIAAVLAVTKIVLDGIRQ